MTEPESEEIPEAVRVLGRRAAPMLLMAAAAMGADIEGAISGRTVSPHREDQNIDPFREQRVARIKTAAQARRERRNAKRLTNAQRANTAKPERPSPTP